MFSDLLERIADLLAIVAGVTSAYYAYESLGLGQRLHYRDGLVLEAGLAFAMMFVFMLDRAGAYNRGNSLLLIRETEKVLRVSVQSFALLFGVTFFLGFLYSRWVIVLAFVFVPLVLLTEKQLVRCLMRHLHGRGYGAQNVLIHGAGAAGRHVFSALVRSPKLGLHPVAMVDSDRISGQRVYEYGYGRERSVPVVAGPLTSQMLQEFGASLVIVTSESGLGQGLDQIAAEAFAVEANVAFVPQPPQFPGVLNDYVDIDGILLGSFAPLHPKPGYDRAKRAFDVVCAAMLLVLMAPAWAAIALLIRGDSQGPVFFRQERIGRNGKKFTLYKFRSMRADAPEYALHPTASNDPRITRTGRWLRHTSIDELPQLLNVLKGDMSLVGPRPEMPFVVETYTTQHRQRLNVLPGITGLWQLSADRMFLIHENIQYDLYYIRNRSFFMDIAILMHTALFAMRGV